MYKPFDKLKKIKIPDRQPKPVPIKEETVDQDEDEKALFLSAMAGVKPLKKKGRQVPGHKNFLQSRPNKDSAEQDALEKFLRGEIEFDIEFSDEYVHGYVHGLDSRIFRKLKNGQFSIQAHLDLHGMNTDQAKLALLYFMREQYVHNKRCVLLIPGRGKNSPLGMGVLKKEVQHWLTREPLKRVVLAFCTALPKHGGTGALYVLLRKYKKTRGKIIWDKYLLDLQP
ncbi:Smr/MutS family protein [Desulfohalobiaceae bacterium Ax17]|jgi:DNA-nicking Smr family endonuclease|uniref:Smr/MutS family protein n=1 Tax=Desulfovulcanus ferrireducens TaxID=2831190 RepID=UPI00207BB52C|nr:Smr/MutS family protein [Desulfovulcanus ferrireducens]MBT8762522.1 Smr/MutS family protein [Desulfovulcanus ferrireducens]